MTAELAQIAGLLEAVAPPERRGIKRDAVRLLHTSRAARTHSHHHFFDLPSLLRAGDLLVVNDSATLPAALTATRANGDALALHVATMIDQRIWLAEPRGTVLCGEELQLPGGGSVVAIAPVEPERPRLWYVWFQLPLPMSAYLAQHGQPIRYGYVTGHFPIGDYQTMFAREPGSSEMPSAARPFTPRVVRELGRAGIELASITLHCGVASFEQPERPSIERYVVSRETAHIVNTARRDHRRVIAVGSTALRALESAAIDGSLVASSGWTDLVIDERSDIRMADGMLTGFHDSTATHQSILRAFLDSELLAEAYMEAAEQAYYCHEFGDSHLIL
jgi:S-adenosylmethionine:tRNA ribosyltransferase-isomerase